MTQTYDLISQTVLPTDASSINLTSIPSSYRDIIVTFDGLSSTSVSNTQVLTRINGDAGSYAYAFIFFRSNQTGRTQGAVSQSIGVGALNFNFSGHITPTNRNFIMYKFIDCFSTNKRKAVQYKLNSPRLVNAMHYGVWNNVGTPLSSIQFVHPTGNFTAGTTVGVYGVVA